MEGVRSGRRDDVIDLGQAQSVRAVLRGRTPDFTQRQSAADLAEGAQGDKLIAEGWFKVDPARMGCNIGAGLISAEDIDERALAARLYQPDMPPLDLIIRTGGEMRLSGGAEVFPVPSGSYACWRAAGLPAPEPA